MECHEPTPAATSIAAGHFGTAISLCGPVINTALTKHLAYEASGSAPVDWSFPINRSDDYEPAQSSSTRPQEDECLAEKIERVQATAHGRNLYARMTGSGGHTVEHFSVVDQMTQMIKRCKGVAAFNAGIFNAAERLAAERLAKHGGLALNWFQLGYDQRGVLGIICFTCCGGLRKATAVGSGSSFGPLDAFIRHCTQASKHEKARANVVAQIEALCADPRLELTRHALHRRMLCTAPRTSELCVRVRAPLAGKH
tara:strand:+ start:320 stop:1084 length:765 start_codon:yes stop_codon:yes gene_type:complete